jgi:RNA polymerase sigma-70 factor (ECF subfamily)
VRYEGVGLPDDELVEQLRRGVPAAFNRVYDAERSRIFGFLLRLSGARAEAEDLLQETFIGLARMAPRLAQGTRLRALLFTIARNAFLSQRRWQRLDLERLHELAMLPPPAPESSPLEHVCASEAQRRCERALLELPLADREVLLLVAVEGLEPSEAAQVLGLSAEATRQRLKRARERLGGLLDDVHWMAARRTP